MFFKKSVYFFAFLLFLSSVSALNEISQTANRLNYYSTILSHTVAVLNSGAQSASVNITCPPDISFSSGSGCSSVTATIINCNVANSGSASYTVTDSGSSMAEYTLSTCYISNVNNSYTGNNVSFIRLKQQELFHTLVEYGRGRGNYFYDNYAAGVAGSGHTGVGCNYVPYNTLFELNFLHKVLNVNHLFGDLNAQAYNATFSCTYPNNTVVREHSISAITTNSSGAYLVYLLPRIDGSWERMGYLSMNFDQSEQYVGELIVVNCTNMNYYLPAAGGYLVVDSNSLALEVRNKEPLTATATTISTIGNGTQEVLITYNITNKEVYTVYDVIIEINAPPYAAFIGTRSELWGAALTQYRVERVELLPGESQIIQLIARFDTSAAPNINSVNLTTGITAEYVTCWEINAYNPNRYAQTLTNIGSATVNMASSSTITSLINSLQIIDNLTKLINTTALSITSTVNGIQYMTNVIQTTTNETNAIVKIINQTISSIFNDTSTLLSNTLIILNDTNIIIEQLDCDLTNDSPICDRVRQLNTTINNIWSLALNLNYTANNLNITIGDINVTGVNVTVNIDWSPVENLLYDIEEFLNCTSISTQANTSVCNMLFSMENTTSFLNSTVQHILNTTLYFNQSIFGNLTFQDILDRFSTINVDTNDVLTELQELRRFDEELVFLVTDSFGLQQQARAEFNNGDLKTASNDLMDANLKLLQAVDRITELKPKLEKEGSIVSVKTVENTALIWKILLMTVILTATIAYLFGKPQKRQVKK